MLKHPKLTWMKKNVRCAGAKAKPPCANLVSGADRFCNQCGRESNRYAPQMAEAFGRHTEAGWKNTKFEPVDVPVIDPLLAD